MERITPKVDIAFKKALNVLGRMNFTQEERSEYEDHLKWLRIETNTLKKAKEEGIVIGKDEGIRIGIEKTAINMLKRPSVKNESFCRHL